MTPRQGDRGAAIATGAGVGLITLMLSWLVGSRLVAAAWEPPAGPIVAMVVAMVTGALAAAVAVGRLLRATSPSE